MYGNQFIAVVGVYNITIKQICIRSCLYLISKKLYIQEFIGKFLIIVFVVIRVGVHIALALTVNVMRICICENKINDP